MSVLDVRITVDGHERTFRAEGNPAVIVAAFRVWLASDDNAFDAIQDADLVDKKAAEVERESCTDAELETVWSGALEARGEAPGLSHAGLQSTIHPERLEGQ